MATGVSHEGSVSAGSPLSGQLSLFRSMKFQSPLPLKSTRTWVLFWVPATHTGFRLYELQPVGVPLAPASQRPGLPTEPGEYATVESVARNRVASQACPQSLIVASLPCWL